MIAQHPPLFCHGRLLRRLPPQAASAQSAVLAAYGAMAQLYSDWVLDRPLTQGLFEEFVAALAELRGRDGVQVCGPAALSARAPTALCLQSCCCRQELPVCAVPAAAAVANLPLSAHSTCRRCWHHAAVLLCQTSPRPSQALVTGAALRPAHCCSSGHVPQLHDTMPSVQMAQLPPPLCPLRGRSWMWPAPAASQPPRWRARWAPPRQCMPLTWPLR